MLTEASIVTVALLWGVTNPFIKKGSDGIEKVYSNRLIVRTILEIKFLFTNIKYLLPMAINQLGSVLYFVALQNSNLSLMVPVTNSLTFLITTLTSAILGEKLPSRNSFLGMFLILAGATCCVLDKIQ